MSKKIAVLGAGGGGYTMAADLSMAGYKVNLYDLPEDAEKNLNPIIKKGGIELISQDTHGNPIKLFSGSSSGFTKISGSVGSDIQEALDDVDYIMLVTPALFREKFIKKMAPYLKDGQILTVWVGYFGALQCMKLLKDLGIEKDIIIAETESIFYNCSKVGEAKVWNKGQKNNILVSVFGEKNKKEAINKLQTIYPQLIPAKNVLETTLSNINSLLHPESVLLNLYKVERKYYPFDEKFNMRSLKAYDLTPGMARFVNQIDIERLSLGKKLGITLNDLRNTLMVWYDSKGKDLYETINNCYAFQIQGATTSFDNRYITEDIPFGLIPCVLLGEQIGVPMENMRALTTIGCGIADRDFWQEGLNLDKIGLKDKNLQEILDCLQ